MTAVAIPTAAAKPLLIFRFGTLPYDEAWRWQHETAGAVRNGAPEALALLQHPPTYSFGRRIRPEHLLVEPDMLHARGASLVESDRGGDVTFHGPGQVVCYPILDLHRRNLGAADYVRLLEQTMIGALQRFGVAAGTVSGRPGVWVGDAKIGAIGVRVQGGISTHGCALNVDTDLAWYGAIVPCGIADAGVTSMAQLGIDASIDSVEDALLEEFARLFDAAFEEGSARGYRGQSPLTGSLRGVPSETPLFHPAEQTDRDAQPRAASVRHA